MRLVVGATYYLLFITNMASVINGLAVIQEGTYCMNYVYTVSVLGAVACSEEATKLGKNYFSWERVSTGGEGYCTVCADLSNMLTGIPAKGFDTYAVDGKPPTAEPAAPAVPTTPEPAPTPTPKPPTNGGKPLTLAQ